MQEIVEPIQADPLPIDTISDRAAIGRGRCGPGRFYLRRYGQFPEQPGVGLALDEEGLKVFDEGVGEPVPAAAARLSMCAWSAR